MEWLSTIHPECLRNGKARLPLPAHVYAEFMGAMMKKIERDGRETIVSSSHLGGYRSAISYFYKQHGVEASLDQERVAEAIFAGHKRKIADMKQNGELPLVEGRQPLQFEGYDYLARIAVEKDKEVPAAMTAHTFLVLSWNLMTRSNSTALVMYDHMSWHEDALVITVPRHKGDQDGKNCGPKHVYANPLEPHICPILALAIYAFGTAFRRPGAKALVFGDTAEKRFSQWLVGIMVEHKEELQRRGHNVKDLGTHSLRKGVATYISGCPGGPSPISIYLRAGWSLGQVQSRYIFSSQGGDQHVGRAACGLCPLDQTFATLPPHFDIRNRDALNERYWRVLTAETESLTLGFKSVIPFLLASLVFHRDWLEKTLHSSHPLKSSRVWTTGILTELKDQVLTGVYQHPTSGLKATGIPPYLLLAHKIEEVCSSVSGLETRMCERFDSLPDALKSSLLNHFSVDGVVPLTEDSVRRIINEAIMNITAVNRAHSEPSISSQTSTAREADSEWQLFSWGGGMRRVPHDFSFPK